MADYIRPPLYRKQERAFFNDKRYSLIEASTKAGKTVAAIAWIIERALAGTYGQNFWWVAPVSDQADIAYRRIQQGLTRGTFTAKDTPAKRILMLNGPVLWFKSGDNPDSLFGEDVYGAVVDEASRVKEESWYALRSTLTATRAPVRIIGNVKGRQNWFYKLARTAQAGDPAMHYEKITVLDAIAAGVVDQEEMEDARKVFPEHIFRELYMAEPSGDSGNPFGEEHIAACTREGLADGPPVAFGIDLAKRADFLTIIGLNDRGQTCVFHRWTGVPWRDSIRRIHQITGEDTPVLVDSTGVGDPVLEELQHEHGNFEGYLFTQVSRQRILEGLAVSIQSHEIEFPDGQIPLELNAFEYVEVPSGVRYALPKESIIKHDDCVMGLALARHKWADTAPGANLIAHFDRQVRQAKNDLNAERENEDEKFLRRIHAPVAAEVLDNELTELYHSTLRSYEPEGHLCVRCGLPVLGGARVSDGVQVWHPECTRANYADARERLGALA